MADGEGYVKEAFLWQYNLILLAAALMVAAITMSPVPLLVGAGAELLYLGTVPSLPGFKRAVRAKQRSARARLGAAELEKLLAELSPSQRDCYYELKNLRDRILENYARVPGGPVLMDSSTGRIDALLESFLRLLSQLNQYRRYLSQTDLKALEKDLAELRVELSATTGSESLREVKRRRVEILEARLERFARAAEGRELLSHQLASIDDFMRLLHEQSVTSRDPEAVNAQLESLATEIQSTDETIREMEAISAISSETGTGTPLPDVPQKVR